MKAILIAILALASSVAFAQSTPVMSDGTRSGSVEQSNPVLTKSAQKTNAVTDFANAEKIGGYAR